MMSEEKNGNQNISTIDGNACGIDAVKLGEGLAAVFRGYSLIFGALADQAGFLNGLQTSGQPAAPVEVTEEKPKDKADEKPAAKPAAKATAKTDKPAASQPEPVEAEAEETADEPAKPSITKAEFLSEVQGMVRKSTAMQKQVKQLMDAYGIKSLSSTPPEQYEAFLKDARDLSRKS